MSPIKSFRIPFVVLLSIILLSGCNGFTRRLNPPPLKSIKPTAVLQSTAVESTPESSTTPVLDAIPAPGVIQIAWLDRTPFEDGLISGSRSVLKQRYDRSVYHLQVNVADDYQTVTLKEEILYTNHEDITLDKVILRIYPAIFGARVKYSGFLNNGIKAQPVIRSNDSVIEFPLKDGLKVGESIVLSIDLEMQMPADPSGNYQVFGFIDKLLTLAHFYPIVAVYDSSGWHDELPPAYGDVVYSDTSYYIVEVTLPGDAVLVSSGISRQSRMVNNHQIVLLAGGPMRDFYLAAGLGLEKISTQVGETTVNSYANPEIQEGNEKALDTAAEALRIFTQDIGPYPYSKFDVLATSTTALGVEYPGVTVINRTIYQPGKNSNNVPNSVYLESTIAHEVGHQWFYNVLGDDQVNQPWLDEFSGTIHHGAIFHREVWRSGCRKLQEFLVQPLGSSRPPGNSHRYACKEL